jgi:hypothetical protein
MSNGNNIFHMAREYTNFFPTRPSKIYPNLDFWTENIPSGNPAWDPTTVLGVAAVHSFAISAGRKRPTKEMFY